MNVKYLAVYLRWDEGSGLAPGSTIAAGKGRNEWLKAATEAYHSLMERNVFTVEGLPGGCKMVGSRWITMPNKGGCRRVYHEVQGTIHGRGIPLDQGRLYRYVCTCSSMEHSQSGASTGSD